MTEVSAEAWTLSGAVLEEAFLRQGGGRKGVDASPGSPSPGKKGRPCSISGEASLPSFQEMKRAFLPHQLPSSCSHTSGGLLGGQLPFWRGASHGSSRFFFVLFEFSALNFTLVKFPDSRCWLPPMPITNTSPPCWWRVLGEATPLSAKRVT